MSLTVGWGAISNFPVVVQKTNQVSSGSVASIAKAYANNVTANNSLLVVCGVGNTTAPSITDTLGNTYKQAAGITANAAHGSYIFYTVGIAAGANTITFTNNGTTASMAMEIYEISGLIQPTATYP